MKVKYRILIAAVASAMFLIFAWVKFDIIIRLHGSASLGAEIVFGLFVYLVYILYCLIGIVALIWAIADIKKSRWKGFIPVIIIAAIIVYSLFVPYTGFYLKANYALNAESRMKTIQMYESGKLSEYQIGMDEYVVPFRLTSQTGTLFVQQENGVLKVMFYVHKGYKTSRVLIFVSDDSSIKADDFSSDFPSGYRLNFSDIQKLDERWYAAEVR